MLWQDNTFEKMLASTGLFDSTKNILNERWYELNEDNEFEYDEKKAIQDYVIREQIDPIEAGMYYGQQEIIRKLWELS